MAALVSRWREIMQSERQGKTVASSTPAPLKLDSLSVEIPRSDQLVMSGTLANPATQTELARYLEGLHGHIVSQRLAAFGVNVRGLTFVNSSAIRVFVDWISRAQAAGYKLSFQIDRSI